jgi:hypothetical protein
MASADQSGSKPYSVNSSQSANTGPTAQKKRFCHCFSSWAFQLTLSAQADATASTGGRESDSVTLEEKRKFLLEHVRSRMRNTNSKPDIVTSIEVFYDTSIISGALPVGISISIKFLGFVQTRAHTTCKIATMQYWIPASWSPVQSCSTVYQATNTSKITDGIARIQATDGV